MSYDTQSRFAVPRRLLARVGFHHLLATTLVLVAATILLGVAAKATGSGLACEANWPQCDAGPFNLLPANLPSFYEWFHRFVAMFAGFAIIATAIVSRIDSTVSSRVTGLVILGAVLTPIQVVLGRETVLRYQMEILSLHFWTALLIFALFLIATVLVWKATLSRRHLRMALGVGLLSVPAHVALSPLVLTDITQYSPEIQTTQYAVTLALLSALVVTGLVGRWQYDNRRVSLVLGAIIGLGLAVIFLGRRAVMTLNPALDSLYLVLAIVLGIAFVGGLWITSARSTRQ